MWTVRVTIETGTLQNEDLNTEYFKNSSDVIKLIIRDKMSHKSLMQGRGKLVFQHDSPDPELSGQIARLPCSYRDAQPRCLVMWP